MIPRVDELRSSPLVHGFGDTFNPPGLTNFLGVVQADRDITGFRSFNFPPLGTGNTVTGLLFIEGAYFLACGEPVTHTWYPDRVEREACFRGIRLNSTLAMVPGRQALVMRLVLSLESGDRRDVEIGLFLRGGVTQSRSGWGFLPPTEAHNVATHEAGAGAVVFSNRDGSAHWAQGFTDDDSRWDGRILRRTVRVEADREVVLNFVSVLDADRENAIRVFQECGREFDAELRRAHQDWQDELDAAFTPGNNRYSGSLPVLHTSDEAIRRIYNNAVVGLLYFKRDNPASIHGRAWDTLMPRYWGTVTFIWDYHLSSLAHALLDPVVMRGYLERWMQMDIHRHFGTEYLNGGGVGQWYSVNDYAMVSLATDYLRYTGNLDWLTTQQGAGGTALDYLLGYARNWEQFKTSSGLADYGGIGNLLECVATYVHEVASLNAANVWALRAAADIAADQPATAAQLRRQADELVAEVVKLYAHGRGFWHARYPDGSTVEVRHCYDFQTVLSTIDGDLGDGVKKEMVDFFFRELHTPNWMRALSANDEDAPFDVRPDHQWSGAYPAWPPRAAQALWRVGEGRRGLEWMHGLAASANQGPFAQAHFVEQASPLDAGGARKAPPEIPYITDWNVSSSGSWMNVVIESIFGVRATLRDGLTATPDFAGFDPDAELTGLRHQGRLYRVTRAGAEQEAAP